LSPIRFLTAAALATAFAVPTAALAQNVPGQPPPGAAQGVTAPAHAHHGHHHSRYLHALRALNLSDAQRAQIRDAVRQTRQANQNADPQTRRANQQALHQRVDALLTPDQRTRLHGMLRHRHGQAPAGAQQPPSER
jgi:Spy/CpxP family protein refolding chaperone